MAGGAVVAADVPRHNLELVPQTSIDLKTELRKLTSDSRSRARQQKDTERQQMAILRAAETELLATSDAEMAVFKDIPVKETFHRGQAHAASARLQLEWFPPCAELAQALLSGPA